MTTYAPASVPNPTVAPHNAGQVTTWPAPPAEPGPDPVVESGVAPLTASEAAPLIEKQVG